MVTCMCVGTCIRAGVCMGACVCTCVRACMCARAYVLVCVRTCMRAYECVFLNMCLYTHLRRHTRTHAHMVNLFFGKYGPPELTLLLNMGMDKFGKHIAGGGALI